MTTVQFHNEALPGGVGQQVTPHRAGQPLSRGEALDLLQRDAAFRSALNAHLAIHAGRACRWELPAWRAHDLDQPFTFVLIDDPGLDDAAPQPEVFAPHFMRLPAERLALAVPNLGRTATLVVPRPGAAPATTAQAGAHLARFVREAGAAQQQALWAFVGQTAAGLLGQRPLWISTAGDGVAWLHVRLEPVPKYYAWQPYTRCP